MEKELFQGYRKFIVYIVGCVILGLATWLKSDHISQIMTSYVMLGGIYIAGNEVKNGVETIRNRNNKE